MKSFPFNEYLRSLREREMRHNAYIEHETRQMYANIEEYFSARGVD